MSVILFLLAVIFIVISTTRFNFHPFLSLLFAAILYGLFAGMPFSEVVNAIKEGFGGTLGNIGILIIAGTIIGVFLEKSGGVFALAEKVLKTIDDKHMPTAMALIGRWFFHRYYQLSGRAHHRFTDRRLDRIQLACQL